MSYKTIKELDTKTLLSYLDSCRRLGGSFNPYYDSGYSPKDSPVFTYEQIKEELATREHIPNKQERRKIRQEKFKNKKQNKEKNRYKELII